MQIALLISAFIVVMCVMCICIYGFHKSFPAFMVAYLCLVMAIVLGIKISVEVLYG